MIAKPFIKCAGGKQKLADDILHHIGPHVLARRRRYFEPFMGGGALFWRFADMGQGSNAVLSDANAELVDTYRVVRDSVNALIRTLSIFDAEYRMRDASRQEEYYYRIRSSHFEDCSWESAARLIFLNKTCFNGLYRVNRKGIFNVPHGRTSSGEPPVICDAENLRACSAALQCVELQRCDFSLALYYPMPDPGDLVYLDPPYEPEPGKASFTAYTAGGANATLQDDVARTFQELADRGVYVVASNSDTPRIRELYRGYKQIELSRSGGMNSDTSKRGRVSELLILGWERT